MIAAATARQRQDAVPHAELLAMLANCHRLAMDRFDQKGTRHPGAHPKPWVRDEFLPNEFRAERARDGNQVIFTSIKCLKVFLPKDEPTRG